MEVMLSIEYVFEEVVLQKVELFEIWHVSPQTPPSYITCILSIRSLIVESDSEILDNFW